MGRGLRTLGAIVLSLAAALPAAAADKPLTIQQKREAVVERVLHGQEKKPWVTSDEYGGRCEHNWLVWNEPGSRMNILVQECDYGPDNHIRFTDLLYDDGQTILHVKDNNSDGLGPDDFFHIHRDGKESTYATLSMKYLDDDDVGVVYSLHVGGEDYVNSFTANGLNPFVKLRLRKLRSAVMTLGSDTYEQMLDDVLANRRPSLPIAELDALCSDLEPYLTKRFDDGAAKSLVGLARSYEKTILEKVKE